MRPTAQFPPVHGSTANTGTNDRCDRESPGPRGPRPPSASASARDLRADSDGDGDAEGDTSDAGSPAVPLVGSGPLWKSSSGASGPSRSSGAAAPAPYAARLSAAIPEASPAVCVNESRARVCCAQDEPAADGPLLNVLELARVACDVDIAVVSRRCGAHCPQRHWCFASQATFYCYSSLVR